MLIERFRAVNEVPVGSLSSGEVFFGLVNQVVHDWKVRHRMLGEKDLNEGAARKNPARAMRHDTSDTRYHGGPRGNIGQAPLPSMGLIPSRNISRVS